MFVVPPTLLSERIECAPRLLLGQVPVPRSIKPGAFTYANARKAASGQEVPAEARPRTAMKMIVDSVLERVEVRAGPEPAAML